MRKFLPGLYFLAILSFGCQPEATDPAAELISKAIEAHGGREEWERLKEVEFIKTTKLFAADGSLEKESIQRQHFVFKPELGGEIVEMSAEDSLRIVYSSNKVTAFRGKEEITDTTLLAKYKDDFYGAVYVFCQPFKLKDPSATITSEGTRLLDGQATEVIKVTYPQKANGQASDIWWYFFDAKTHRLRANMVQHGQTYALVYNTSYDALTPFLFNATRESYRVDEKMEKQFLRASYQYQQINTKF